MSLRNFVYGLHCDGTEQRLVLKMHCWAVPEAVSMRAEMWLNIHASIDLQQSWDPKSNIVLQLKSELRCEIRSEQVLRSV